MVYILNFSSNFCGGRKIAQLGGEIFMKVSLKVLAKFCADFVSSKFHQNRNLNITSLNVFCLRLCTVIAEWWRRGPSALEN